MAKELPYFRFTVSEWLNDDISLEDYSTKGLFADICAWYWFKDCSVTLTMLKKRFNNANKMIYYLIELQLIKVDSNNETIQIKFLDEQFDLLSEKRQKYVEAGRIGGLKRSSNAKATLKQRSSYKDKDNNKDNNKEKNIIPPTIEMIKSYCKERSNNVDANRFFDFYESKGWIVGKTKMRDWQSAVRTWEEKKPENKMPF